ncbi:MAG: hypothetical protein H6701_06245 [Myxococcales bacterium]|nr:hypothetical protein [Myxococcales bacterium]
MLLHGGTLHATHVTPEMTAERVSIELRWLPADHPGRDDGASEDDGNQSPA